MTEGNPLIVSGIPETFIYLTQNNFISANYADIIHYK